MTKLLLLLVASFVLLSVAFTFAEPAAKSDGKKADSMLRHVVLFKFKDSAKLADVRKVVDAFAALPKKIDVIADFEWGTDVSVENKADGFTHAFFVSFEDEKGRETYLPHPAHNEFKSIVGPFVDKVLVIDYWSKK